METDLFPDIEKSSDTLTELIELGEWMIAYQELEKMFLMLKDQLDINQSSFHKERKFFYEYCVPYLTLMNKFTFDPINSSEFEITEFLSKIDSNIHTDPTILEMIESISFNLKRTLRDSKNLKYRVMMNSSKGYTDPEI